MRMTDRPDVLLIVLDATRWDDLSLSGAPVPTTPALERLAADGVVFERAFAPAPWTPPSHASLFTGLYPSRHGVDVGENLVLGPEHPTLAELLRGHGYRTLAILPDVHLSSLRGFHRGFDDWIETWRIPYLHLERDWLHGLARNLVWGRDKRASYTTRVIRRWIREADDRPLFVFANYKTAHNRYQPPRPFRGRFEERRPRVDVSRARRFSANGGYSYMAGRLPLGEDELRLVRSWYRGAIAFMDAKIAELIDELRAAGRWGRTLVIVTADHGENFGEHGLAYHLFCLYDTLIRVPLLLAWPGGLPRGRRVEGLASLVDVVPTLVDLLDLAVPAGAFQGVSLAPFASETARDVVFAEFGRPHYMLGRLRDKYPDHDFSRFDRGLQCVRTRGAKLVQGTDGSEELYDLGADPGETRNIVREAPLVAGALRARLDDWRASMEGAAAVASAEPDADPQVVKALEDLGYF